MKSRLNKPTLLRAAFGLLLCRFLEAEANSGIFVRTGPTSHDNETGWPDNGIQIQCKDALDEAKHLASMIPYGAPPFEWVSNREMLKKACKPTGEWQIYEITCLGETLSVKLNGELITLAIGIKNPDGHIGIQGEHGSLEFRKIEVMTQPVPKDFPSAEKGASREFVLKK